MANSKEGTALKSASCGWGIAMNVSFAPDEVTVQTPFNFYWVLEEPSPEGIVRLDLCSPDPASLTALDVVEH
jgi:hypothetical protein